MAKGKNRKKPVSPWLWVAALLLLAAVVTYPALEGKLLNYDDERYIDNNPHLEKVDLRVFSQYFDGHYHPITLLSLAADRQLFSDPIYGHHLTNWLLHLANALLVYLLLGQLFHQRWLALGTALLWAVHPMAVESYAWMTERKNVLYSFFFLGAALAYGRYLLQKQAHWFWLCFALFMLSIFSKAQAMMLVPVLFLLDLQAGRSWRQGRLYLEKIPFAVVSVAFVVLTSAAQEARWGDLSTTDYNLLDKFLLASTALAEYLGRGLVPLGLSAYYPYPEDVGRGLSWHHYVAPLIWPVLGGLLWWTGRHRPRQFFGLAFFLINIVLLLKFLDVPYGKYYMADRYNYLPLVGLMLVLVTLLQDLASRQRWPVAAPLALIFIFYGWQTRERLDVWQKSTNLWGDVLQNYPDYAHGHNMRALGYVAEGRNEAALHHWKQARELNTEITDAWVNSSVLLYRTGQKEKALRAIERAQKRFPNNASVQAMAANLYLREKRLKEAMAAVEEARKLAPEEASHAILKARVLLAADRQEEARQVLAGFPGNAQAEKMLATLDRARQQESAQAAGDPVLSDLLDRAIRHGKAGELEKSLNLLNRVLQRDSANFMALINRGSTLARMQRFEPALRDYLRAVELQPEEGRVHFLLGMVYRDTGRLKQGCHHLHLAQKYGWPVTAEHLAGCP